MQALHKHSRPYAHESHKAHAVLALKAHRAAQNAERLKAGSLWQDHGLIFCTHSGRPIDSHNVARTSFKPLLERAELPDIRFNDLWHTCATLLLSWSPSQTRPRASWARFRGPYS